MTVRARGELRSPGLGSSVIRKSPPESICPTFCLSSTRQGGGCSLHNTLTRLTYLVTHTGAGLHALTDSYLYIRARACEICVSLSFSFPFFKFRCQKLSADTVITHWVKKVEALGVALCVSPL